MIESTRAAAAAATTATPAPAAAKAEKTTKKSFAGELAKAAERPDGEITKKVSGHPYSRIENGDDKGRYVNQVAGGPREGAIFRLVERGDRVFHVYGSGRDKLVVGLDVKPRTDAPTTA